MFWHTILTISLLGLKEICGQQSGNHTGIDLKPEDGWVPFNFGRVDEHPFNSVRFRIGLRVAAGMEERSAAIHGPNQDGPGNFGMKKCYLEVTDAFCPGDRFEVIKLGTGGLGPLSILNTTYVEYNREVAREVCDGFPVQCSKSTSNPEVAYIDEGWSSGKVLMAPGNHTVVIKPINSPYCSGSGFVRISCGYIPHPHPPQPPQPPHPVHPLCQFTEGGFRLVKKPVQGQAAGAICSAMGMKLAEITNANFVASTNVSFKCSGPLSTTWIGAWNGQTWEGQEGLGLTVSTASPGGSINVYNDGKARNVLCQEL